MRIAFLDLTHMTSGVHTVAAPLGLGMIARYVQLTVAHPFEFRIFKDPRKARQTLRSWRPDVLALGQYSWNSRLNSFIAQEVRERHPDCIVLAGGPNLEITSAHRERYLHEHPFIDVCFRHDGEIPFRDTIVRLLDGESIADIRANPVAGAHALDRRTGRLVESSEAAPRLSSLDEVGSLYADGVLDEILDEGFHPLVQTHRGCPFTCAFCHGSHPYHRRMLFLSPDVFRREMEYLGQRYAGQPQVTLYIANTNMSLFNQDFEIAEIIRQTRTKYDWPDLITVSTGKDPRKLLRMLGIIKFKPSLALQTLTPQVLQNINRRNIPFEDFARFQQAVGRINPEPSNTALILCLPGETKDSFRNSLTRVLNSGVQTVTIFTLMRLTGTPLAADEAARRWGHLIRHRVVPRQFTELDGRKIFDTEEVVVGTNTMSFADYLELRGLSFTINCFHGAAELRPLVQFLQGYHLDVAGWVYDVHARIDEHPAIRRLYQAFLQETRDELFPTRAALTAFYERPENFAALRTGRLGDNLLRKYKYLLLAENFAPALKLAASAARRLARRQLPADDADRMVADLERYLATRDMRAVLARAPTLLRRDVRFAFDVPTWLEQTAGAAPLERFARRCRYGLDLSTEYRQWLEGIEKLNRDKELSLQMLYRDGNMRHMWPQWTRQDAQQEVCFDECPTRE